MGNAVIDPLDAPGYLTPRQRAVVDAPPDFLLAACPGSGKTRATGARLVVRAEAGARVAVTSYTNIGVEQIRGVISGELGRAAGPQHFIGTLHQFLLRYVFYPFAHAVMGSRAPHLVDAEHAGDDVCLNGDNRLRVSLSAFRYRPNGTLLFSGKPPGGWTREQVAAAGQAVAFELKRRAAARGRATFDDAMYWSLRVLREVPGVASSVAARFDELVVDEAQDTSELQLACLLELSRSKNLRSLVLVGDMDQSIYAFQGASPQGVQQLVDERAMRMVPLLENHRSSQLICNVAVHFSSRDRPDEAVGEHANHTAQPELILYDPARGDAVVQEFLERVHELGIDPERATVLARNSTIVSRLNNTVEQASCAPRPKALGRATVALRHGTLGRYDLLAVDKIVAFAAWGETDSLDGLDAEGRRSVRRATIELLISAPELDRPLQQWIKESATVLRQVVGSLVDEPARRAGDVLRSAVDREAVTARSFFAQSTTRCAARTVHDVKGASKDAVLIVARERTSRHFPSEAETWTAILRGLQQSPESEEERRILYVALTRARQYCAIGLPESTAPDVVASLRRAGFLLRCRPAGNIR